MTLGGTPGGRPFEGPDLAKASAGAAPWALALLGAVAVLGAALLVLSEDAQATHQRGGSIFWDVENVTAQGVEVRIKMIEYWGFSVNYPNWGAPYYHCPNPTCAPGDVLRTGVTTGDSGAWFPGMPIETPFGPVDFDARIIAVDAADGWFGIEAIENNAPANAPAGIRVFFPTPRDPNTNDAWLVYHQPPCCRIDNPSSFGGLSWYHINNPFFFSQRLETKVFADGVNRAPAVAMPPFVNCDHPSICTFRVPALDPDGDALAYRLATPAEMGGGLDQPGPPDAPNALSVDPTTGVVTWNTNGATTGPWPPAGSRYTVYSTQIVAEDGVNGTKSSVDFFVRLMPTLPPPVWLSPSPCPGHTQMATLMVIAGENVNFTLRAQSPVQGRTVKIGVSSLPHPDATYTLGPQGNPTWARFDWNTTGDDLGVYIMTFWAYDDVGAGALLCPIVIRVVTAIPDFTCTTAPWPDALKVLVSSTLFDPRGLVRDEWWRIDGGPELRPGPTQINRPPPGGNFTLSYSVRDAFGNVMGTTKTCYARPNLPPVMQAVADQSVMSTRTLIFPTLGSDPDGDPLEYLATGLPPGATLDPGTGYVHYAAPRVLAPVTYTVTEWVREGLTTPPRDILAAPLLDSNQVTYRITVLPLPAPGPTDPDGDADGVVDRLDNCPVRFNDDQGDADDDGTGDACEPRTTGGGDQADVADAGAPGADRDGVPDLADLCPAVADPSQADLDRDGRGDACDPDMDGDGVPQLDGLGRLLDRCPTDRSDACAAGDAGGPDGDIRADAGGAGADTDGAAGADVDATDGATDTLLARVPAWGWGLGVLALLAAAGLLALALRRRS